MHKEDMFATLPSYEQPVRDAQGASDPEGCQAPEGPRAARSLHSMKRFTDEEQLSSDTEVVMVGGNPQGT